ncbi:unnamed protein product [Gadus morhua 'NCC']
MHSFPIPLCCYYQHCSFIMCDDDNILWNSYTGEERPNSRVNLLKTIPVTCLCVTSNITLILYPFLRCHGVDIPSPRDQRFKPLDYIGLPQKNKTRQTSSSLIHSPTYGNQHWFKQ